MESGSGNGSLDTNFSCYKPGLLNPHSIADSEHWLLRHDVRPTNEAGIPIALVLGAMFLVATCWNLFVLVLYIYKRHLLKEPVNILLFTLTITDLLVCLIIMPTSITVYSAGEFIMGDNDRTRCYLCSTQGFFFVFLTIVSIHLLAMLSVDRCILLSCPMKYPKFRKARIWIPAIILVLSLCFVISILPALGFGLWEFNKSLGICFPRWTPLSNFYYMFLVILEWCFPFLVLVITNVCTCRIVSKFLKRKLVRQKTSTFDNNNTNRNNNTNNNKNNNSNTEHVIDPEVTFKRKQKQLMKIFGALLLTNTVTWSPILIMFIVVAITDGSGIPGWIYTVCWFFYLLNPVIHPIIESFFIKELRGCLYKTKRSVRSSVRHLKTGIVKLKSISQMDEVQDNSTTSTDTYVP